MKKHRNKCDIENGHVTRVRPFTTPGRSGLRIFMLSIMALCLLLISTACDTAADPTETEDPGNSTTATETEETKPAEAEEDNVFAQSIPLEGVNNARELGGYITEDGRTINSGMLFRTARLDELTEADITLLSETYNLRDIVDFRYDSELEEHPTPEIEGVTNTQISVLNPAGLTNETEDESSELSEAAETPPYENDYLNFVLSMGGASGVKEAMSASAAGLITEEIGQEGFRQFFEILLKDEEGAVLWHCNAGKDRTGVATALVLGALGCDRETIITDYLLTNEYMAEEIEAYLEAAKEETDDEDLLDGIRLLTGVDQAYVEAALDAIDENYGSMETYLEEAMQLSEDDINVLIKKYTN